MSPAVSRKGTWIGVVVAACLLAAPGCGGDDDERGSPRSPSSDTRTAPTTHTKTEAADANSDADRRPPPTNNVASGDGRTEAGSEGVGSREDQPGGAGDEISAETQAEISGEGGELSPGRVRVPPFIAIRVELRSVDGAAYRLSGGGKRIAVGGAVKSASAEFAGLRPDKRLILSGPSGRVVVEPSAEPGP